MLSKSFQGDFDLMDFPGLRNLSSYPMAFRKGMETLTFLGETCFLTNCKIQSPNPYKTCRLLMNLKSLSQKYIKIIGNPLGL